MNVTIKPTDTEYQEGTITRVEAGDDGWEINWRQNGDDYDGWCFWCPNTGVEPKPGSDVRFYGRGIGYPVRGLVVDDSIVFYRTKDEQVAKQQGDAAERERKQRQKYEEDRADFARRVAALPQPFCDRIAGFHRRNPDFGWEHEAYELFCCEQAVAIADALKTPEAIRAFHDKPWEEQKQEVPALEDGHSGNTFGCACSLASTYLSQPEHIPQMHGALCPLVGCAEYGCWSLEASAAD